MITFKQFLSEALDPEKIHQKYYSDIDKTDFYTILNLDPTTISKRGKVRKVGKYVKFIMNWYKKFPGCIHEDLNGALTYFIDNQSEFKPIEQYKDCGKFVDAVNLERERKEKLEKDNPIVEETKNWLIRELNTEEGSQHFGADRGWCTASKDDCYFGSYKKKGNLYIFYQKPEEKPHAQLFVNKNGETEFMFPYNEAADVDQFMDETEELVPWMKSVGVDYFDGIKFGGRKFKYEIRDNVVVFTGMLDLSDLDLNSLMEFVEELPFGLKEYSTDQFNCSDNNLTSLEGAPISSNGFQCDKNNLTSLDGLPDIREFFSCDHNKLTSLEGGPKNVDGFYTCSHNNLKTLKGAPVTVGGVFMCSKNTDLISLEGGPQIVNFNYDCNTCNLESLKGAPSHVGGSFNCKVNKITSLEGIPKVVNGDFLISYNPRTFTNEDLEALCDIGGLKYV